MTDESKTIIAVATPAASGAIAIIRISGSEALTGVKKVFSSFKNNEKIEPRKAYFGVIEAGEYKDECLVIYFNAPHSYTGEEVIEIYCHGSYILASGIVRYLVENAGFSYAEGGDFTARAFKNGKLDLTKAEGVYDMIAAESQAEIRGAYSLLSGKLSGKIGEIQQKIIEARAATEAAIDYPEEDIEEQTEDELKKLIENIKVELDGLVGTYKEGRIMRDGVSVALVGKPNAGKSSLMNALLGYERAIVTAEKGTTRDTLTEKYIYKGLKFNLTDTAGLREATSEPEKLGIKRAVNAAKESDIVLVVTENGNIDDTPISDFSGKVIIVENKIDQKQAKLNESVKVSALTGEGINELKEKIYALTATVSTGGAVINNERQYACTVRAKEHIDRAVENIGMVAIELISSDLYDAYVELGRITGITGSDAVAAEIFRKFCVGK
jgi:tRNA modification GTPase